MTFPHRKTVKGAQRIVVLRHGERRDSASDAPLEEDPPLTSKGRADVARVAEKLKHYFGAEEARQVVLIVSPFLRTFETAEALQAHGIGSERAMVLDNTICEVFGPSRIKFTKAPSLKKQLVDTGFGGLPEWGESVIMAADRYVSNFLRNGDKYAGEPLPVTDSAEHRGSENTESVKKDIPHATINPRRMPSRRPMKTTHAKDARRPRTLKNGDESSVPSDANNQESCDDNASGQNQSSTSNVLLVTHGDAISSVLTHFYPLRVVYEADFLSYIAMNRDDLRSQRYTLEESSGVHWIIDGVETEQPPTVSLPLSSKNGCQPPIAGDTPTSCEPSLCTSGAACTVASSNGLTSSAKNKDDHSPPTQGTLYRPIPRLASGKGQRPSSECCVSNGHTRSIDHPSDQKPPNEVEGCERTRLPTETPLQSSINRMIFKGHCMGYSGDTSLCALSEDRTPDTCCSRGLAGNGGEQYSSGYMEVHLPFSSSEGWRSCGLQLGGTSSCVLGSRSSVYAVAGSCLWRVLTAGSQCTSLLPWCVADILSLYAVVVIAVEALLAAVMLVSLYFTEMRRMRLLLEHLQWGESLRSPLTDEGLELDVSHGGIPTRNIYDDASSAHSGTIPHVLYTSHYAQGELGPLSDRGTEGVFDAAHEVLMFILPLLLATIIKALVILACLYALHVSVEGSSDPSTLVTTEAWTHTRRITVALCFCTLNTLRGAWDAMFL